MEGNLEGTEEYGLQRCSQLLALRARDCSLEGALCAPVCRKNGGVCWQPVVSDYGFFSVISTGSCRSASGGPTLTQVTR
jgi:hypothetical protein